MKRWLHLVIGLAISVAAVWYSMRGVRLGEVWSVLLRSNLALFGLVMLFTLVGFLLRAVRWRSLLSGRRASFDSLFSSTMIGFMANNVLPLRLGEFVRAWALARREKCSTTMVLATVVVERAVDMLTLLAILGITLLVHPIRAGTKAAELTQAGATSLIALTVGLTIVLVVLERRPTLFHSLLERLSRFLPERHRGRGAAALDHFVEGLGLFRDAPRLLWVFLLSFLMFGCFALAQQISLEALGIHLPWYAGLSLMVIVAFAIMAPAAPGYIGTMNLACVAGLILFGVTNAVVANSYSWFYWLGQWLPVTSVGFFYLQREGLSLRSLERAQESSG
ncbi:MAG TPA: lysylphosphatidylglycerol synthase transmembrane domain-containing protein [Terriglobales bacterium]|nr:lysylphosphatidylglycerol synthase transmembrane domain-containing protein [Terriglobales bacterium]